MKLNLSFTDNDKIRTRLIDNENMFLDNSFNFHFNDMKKLNQSDQKDLYIKKNEKVDEDNFIFELTKEDDKNIIENIEKEDNEIKNMRDINKEGAFDIRKEQKINLENKYRSSIFVCGSSNPRNSSIICIVLFLCISKYSLYLIKSFFNFSILFFRTSTEHITHISYIISIKIFKI